MPILLLLFIVLPAAELMLLIEIGTRIGTAPTLALIVAYASSGTWPDLARRLDADQALEYRQSGLPASREQEAPGRDPLALTSFETGVGLHPQLGSVIV